MKNIYLFFIFLVISGCGFNLISKAKTTPIYCPSILFSSEHKVYIDSSAYNISLDNIEYRSEINNATFYKNCYLKDNIFSSELSILFILQPLINELDTVEMPFYIAILNQNKEIQDIQFFSVIGKFEKDLEKNIAIETDITKTLNLEHKNINENSTIIIGYVLDDKRIAILD